MLVISSIIIFVVLGIIIYQDFRQRKISALTLPILFMAFMAIGLKYTDGETLFLFFCVNFSFVAFLILILTLYLSIKDKKLVNITKDYLGIGDILFFVAITCAFSPVNYILFFNFCLLLTIFLNIKLAFSKRRMAIDTIPLAAYFSLVLIPIVALTNVFSEFNLYSNSTLQLFLSK